MSTPEPAHTLVQHLAAALAAGTLTADSTNAPAGLAATWASIHRRLHGDRTAEAILHLFTNDPTSADLQRRLSSAIAAHFSENDLRAMLTPSSAPPIRAHIAAAEDAHIQNSGHTIIAPTGPVDLTTTVGPRGRIIDSRITIIGSTPTSTPTTPPPTRSPLPATLSADGIHFTYGHALLIGIGTYQSTMLNVSGGTTVNDTRALDTLLRDPQRAAYPPDHIRTLCDADATRTRILDELAALAQRLAAAPNSTALISFAGHGEPCGDSYALLPHDTEWTRLTETAITAALFHDAIARIRANARRLIILLNCCHAGGIGDAILGTDPLTGAAPPPTFYQPLAHGSGHIVISAARPGQKAGARSSQHPEHSPFGAHLLAALQGHAPGTGPGIGIFELFTYLRLHVPPDAAALTYQGAPLRQEPLFYASQLDDNITIALRPTNTSGTLGTETTLIQQLIAQECQLATTGGTPAQLAARDRLLAQIASTATDQTT